MLAVSSFLPKLQNGNDLYLSEAYLKQFWSIFAFYDYFRVIICVILWICLWHFQVMSFQFMAEFFAFSLFVHLFSVCLALFSFFSFISVAILYRSGSSSYLVSPQYRWFFNNWFLLIYQTCPLNSWTFMTGILLICLTRTNVNNALSTCNYFLNPILLQISLLLQKSTLSLQLLKQLLVKR